MPGHCLGKRSQTESECWKTETEIGTPARVEAETWKFARQRSSSRALGTRGLYVLWNYYAANSHAATPAERRRWPGVPGESKLKVHAVVHSRSNARWMLESTSLEALGMKTASRKLPKSLRLYRQCVFLLFFFFFFFFFLATHKQVRPRNEAVPVLHLNSKLVLATIRPARSAFFHNNVTWQYTLHI